MSKQAPVTPKGFISMIILASFIVLVCAGSPLLGSGDTGSGVENYYRLAQQYRKWDLGLFGSRKYNELLLLRLLNSLVEKEIQTPGSYTLATPADPDDIEVICKVQDCRWLKIEGPVNRDSLKKIMTGSPGIMKKMWRTNRLVSVKGRLRKFYLGRDSYGDTVTLFFHEIFISVPETGTGDSTPGTGK